MFSFKNISVISAVTFLIFSVLLILSCKKEKPTPPSITTADVTEISYTTAVSGGNITADNGGTISARGVCWNISQNPALTDSKTTDSTGIGVFTSLITGLTQGKTYYVRAYATNSAGTAFGTQVSFIASSPPVVTTASVTGITQTTAISGGNIIAADSIPIITAGVCWSTNQYPTVSDSKTSEGSGTENFTSNITGLIGNSIYYIRAYATNRFGATYGNQVCFTTSPMIPTVTTDAVTLITSFSCKINGNISSDGGAPLESRGFDWSTHQNFTFNYGVGIGSGEETGFFTYSIRGGLLPNTTYYVIAWARNSVGISYGDVVSFTTLQDSKIADIDGNIYNTVTIGKQRWMTENLRTTRYNEGTAIPYITDSLTWQNLDMHPGYCWYNNDTTFKKAYGALYKCSATLNLCPDGWGVPDYNAWKQLSDSVPAGKLKEAGTSHWRSPNDANNKTGFTALPGGIRNSNGHFKDIRLWGYWWSSTSSNPWGGVWAVTMGYNSYNAIMGSATAAAGISVRCYMPLHYY